MKRRNSFFAGIGLRASKFHIRKTLFMLLVSSLLCDFGCVENYYVMKARPCGNHIALKTEYLDTYEQSCFGLTAMLLAHYCSLRPVICPCLEFLYDSMTCRKENEILSGSSLSWKYYIRDKYFEPFFFVFSIPIYPLWYCWDCIDAFIPKEPPAEKKRRDPIVT